MSSAWNGPPARSRLSVGSTPEEHQSEAVLDGDGFPDHPDAHGTGR
jgi:hypothetical protein